MKSNKEYRFADNPKEKEFHDSFLEEFKNNNIGLSAIIYGWKNDNQTIPNKYLTEDELNILLNYTQWLGSHVGQYFLKENGFEQKSK